MFLRVLMLVAIALAVACSDDTNNGSSTDVAGADAGELSADAGECADTGTQYVNCVGLDAAQAEFDELAEVTGDLNERNVTPGPDDETIRCDGDPVHGCEASDSEESCVWRVLQRGGQGGKPYAVCDCDYELTDDQRERLCD